MKFFGHCLRFMIIVVVIIICDRKNMFAPTNLFKGLKYEINNIYIAKHEQKDKRIVYSFIK